MTLSQNGKLALSLLLLRLGIFVVMFVWTLDKFVNPSHSATVFAGFYKISGVTPTEFMLVGTLQMVLVLAAFTMSC